MMTGRPAHDAGEIGVSEQPELSEIRIILLGSKSACKCLAGNTILSRDEFAVDREIVESMRSQGVVAENWRVSVVITPGWWKTYSLRESSELMRMELVHSLALCPPGPHAFLLVINMDTIFSEKHRRAVEEHVEHLGEDVWNHTIVLLNYCGEWQEGNTGIERHIERTGKALQWAVKKCGNRYHILNNKDSGDGTQVRQLMHEIEKMVAGHSGRLFEIDIKKSQDVEEQLMAMKERAKQREIKVKAERETLRDQLKGEVCRFPELRMVLLGCVLVGKTTMANAILGEGGEVEEKKTTHCVSRRGEVDGRAVTVVDTPGWWQYSSVQDTPEMVKQEIVGSVSLCLPGPHAILLVIQPGVSFKEAYRRSIKEHLELLGPDVWRNCVVLFNFGNWLGAPTVEQHIESEGRPLRWLLKRCGNRYHVLEKRHRGDDGSQVTELLETVESMAAANSLLQLPAGGQSGKLDDGAAEVGPTEAEWLVEAVEEVWKRKWEEFLENMERIVISPEKASSIEMPPNLSSSAQGNSSDMVTDWLENKCTETPASEMSGKSIEDDEGVEAD